MPLWYSEPQHCCEKIVNFPERLSKEICDKDNQAADQEEDVNLPKEEHEAGKIANASIPFIEGLSQEVRTIAASIRGREHFLHNELRSVSRFG